MSMRILSLDSSATSASVCLFDTSDNRIIGEFYINTKLTHSQTLVPMIDSLLNCTNTQLNDVDCFAVNTGPGSFTGIRIGVSVIKGMAMALQKPCVATSTLESIAYNFIDNDNVIVCACMDARRNQVYNALFKVENGNITRLCDDRAIAIEDLYKEFKEYDEQIILSGDGANLCYSQKPEDINVILSCASKRYQKASCVAICAEKLYYNNEISDARSLMPSYLRPSQAERERKNKEKEC